MEDFRQSNPKLHALHVRYAYEDLQLINQFLDHCNSISRVSIAQLASEIHLFRQHYIIESAAYQEAAWMLMAGIDLPREEANP